MQCRRRRCRASLLGEGSGNDHRFSHVDVVRWMGKDAVLDQVEKVGSVRREVVESEAETEVELSRRLKQNAKNVKSMYR